LPPAKLFIYYFAYSPGQPFLSRPQFIRNCKQGWRTAKRLSNLLCKLLIRVNCKYFSSQILSKNWLKGCLEKLNQGECEAIALSQSRKGRLLTNDKRAVRYCREHGITVIDLPVLLRWLWTRNIVSQTEVKALLDKMKAIENLQLSLNALAIVLAPR